MLTNNNKIDIKTEQKILTGLNHPSIVKIFDVAEDNKNIFSSKYRLTIPSEKEFIDVIENEMDKIRSEIPGRLTDKTAESLFCTPVDVPVLLDENCDIVYDSNSVLNFRRKKLCLK